MPAVQSVYGRLLLSLGFLLILGGALLLLIVAIDYHLPLSAIVDPKLKSGAWSEIEQHVVWPLLIFVGLAVLAIVPTVRFALKPLMQAGNRLQAAHDPERGYRLIVEKFPSEIRPFADAINRLLSHLEDLAAQQEAFAADVAHELRTPLAIFALEIDGVDDPVRSRLKSEVLAMQRLIDQLLLLAQVDAAAKTNAPMQDFDLVEVATEVAAALAPAAIGQGRSLALESVGDAHLVKGWREATAAAVRNLVENAIRVTPEGSTITLVVGPGLTICVQDGGPGMDAKTLRKLTDRHARADYASANGAGLGLAIVQRIIAAHNGVLTTDFENRTLALQFINKNM